MHNSLEYAMYVCTPNFSADIDYFEKCLSSWKKGWHRIKDNWLKERVEKVERRGCFEVKCVLFRSIYCSYVDIPVADIHYVSGHHAFTPSMHDLSFCVRDKRTMA